MTFDQFENLSLEEKVDALGEEGVYLMNRQNSIYHIFLYGIGRLYVEVLFLKKTNLMQNAELVTTEKVINSYLNQLTVEQP